MSDSRMYMMPVHFGPCLGPRQNPDGERFLRDMIREVTNFYLVYESRAEEIKKYLPDCMTLDAPHVILNFRMNKKLAWLAGHGYNLYSVRVPVTWHGKREEVRGFFMLAIWENHADPIMFGREQLGYCKVFADMEDAIEYPDRHYRATASSWGFTFLETAYDFSMLAANASDIEQILFPSDREGDINHKYIPKTGDGFVAEDISYYTLTPFRGTFPEGTPVLPAPERIYGSGTVRWHRPSFDDMPTQYRIVQALHDLPVVRVIGAAKTTAKSLNDSYDQRILR